MSDNSNLKDLKRKRVKSPPSTNITIKKERGSGEAKCEILMQNIIDSDGYSEFIREYCSRRMNYHKTVASKFFQSIKKDLNEMIQTETIFLYVHTSLVDSFQGNESKPILQFVVTGKNEGNKGNKIYVSKYLDKQYNEEKFFPWFECINRLLLNECEAFNNIERREIKKLIDKCYYFLNIRYNKITSTYLTYGDILSPQVVDDVLMMYKEKENTYVIEYIDRKLEYLFTPNQLYIDFIHELDYMIQKRDTAIPVMFNICYDAKTKTWQLAYQRKNMNKNITKLTTVNFLDIDKFECYRACSLIFEWFLKIANEYFSDKQIEDIKNKIDAITDIINND